MTRQRVLTEIVPLAVLLTVLGIYLSIDVQIHFLLHLFLGGTTALMVGAAIGLRTGWFPPWLPLVTIGAVINSIPDVLYLYFHVAHAPWMDVFQWHIETHFMVGFPITWYLIFMLALGAYFTAQAAPRSSPLLRIGPFGLLLAVVAGAVVWAHERVPAGVIDSDHQGHLLGWIFPVLTTAAVLLAVGLRAPGAGTPTTGSSADSHA